MSEVIEKELPEGWEWVPLMEAYAYLPTGVGKFDGTCLYYSTGSVKDKIIKAEQEVSYDKRPSRANRQGQLGDVLQARMAETDKAIIVKKELEGNLFSTGFMQLRPHIITNETTLYLYYLMKSSLFLNQRDQYATGTTQVALTDNRARNILVPIAPLDMQKQIVADIEVLFSHIDAGIAALKKAKQLLEQYRQSVLKAAVTGELSKEWRQENGVNYDKSWQPLMLGDVADIIDPNPSHRYPPYDNGDVPLLATKQMVGDDDWDESTAKLTTTEFYEKRKSLHGFKSDDIIFARKGRLGLARRPPKLNHYAFSHTVFIVRGRSEINSDYLLWFLRREEVISWLLMEINVAAGVPTLGKAILKKLPLLLPSKEEQKFITEQLEKKITAICRISESIEIQLKKAEKNKQSILASAFTGRIN